jgi:hypothetical protein
MKILRVVAEKPAKLTQSLAANIKEMVISPVQSDVRSCGYGGFSSDRI